MPAFIFHIFVKQIMLLKATLVSDEILLSGLNKNGVWIFINNRLVLLVQNTDQLLSYI